MNGYLPTWKNRLSVPCIYSVGKRGGSKYHLRVGDRPACEQKHHSGKHTGSGFVRADGVVECKACEAILMSAVSDYNLMMCLG